MDEANIYYLINLLGQITQRQNEMIMQLNERLKKLEENLK